MSFMDQLENHRMPTADDVEISLPPRREPKKQPEVDSSEGSLELGQHGGSADAAAASGGRGDVVAAAPEPTPQRDEPDDGEHTDSTEEQVAARARQVTEDDPDAQEAPGETVVEPDAAEEPAEAPAAFVEDERSVKEVLAGTPGSRPLTFNRASFSFGDDVPSVLLKRFPQPIVDRLRLLIAPSVGGEFAEMISAQALITAFLVASLGVELDLDENTAAAAGVFRTTDARMSGVEDKVEQVLDNVGQLAHAMKVSLSRIADTGNIVDGLEFSMAYLIADRVAKLTETNVNEANVDVTQKKVLVARERIRKSSKEQRTIEKQQDGRRMT
jgi:hypothetical protein